MNDSIYLQTKVIEAFQYFNDELFNSELPLVIINFSRHNPKSFGYYSPQRWQNENDQNQKNDEINLNPAYFKLGLKYTYSTLVHEMVHLWQQCFGHNPPKKAYHNKEWAEKMKQVGLYPSNTGEVGGKETGQKCSHYIIEGGLYDVFFEKLPQSAVIDQISLEAARPEKEKSKSSKTKFTCLECGFNAWAKPDAKLICGNHEISLNSAKFMISE